MQSFEQYKNLTISQCNHTDSHHIVMQQFPSSQKQLQCSQIVESAVKWADKKKSTNYNRRKSPVHGG